MDTELWSFGETTLEGGPLSIEHRVGNVETTIEFSFYG